MKVELEKTKKTFKKPKKVVSKRGPSIVNNPPPPYGGPVQPNIGQVAPQVQNQPHGQQQIRRTISPLSGFPERAPVHAMSPFFDWPVLSRNKGTPRSRQLQHQRDRATDVALNISSRESREMRLITR